MLYQHILVVFSKSLCLSAVNFNNNRHSIVCVLLIIILLYSVGLE